MLKIFYARRTFVRQLHVNDCGLACLSMILNGIGRGEEINGLRRNVNIPDVGGLSLFDLKEISNGLGLDANCVEMEIDFLRKNRRPCILHTTDHAGNNHFQVCYHSEKRGKTHRYLLADPARQVHYMDEAELIQIWKTKAALYFNDLPANSQTPRKSVFGLFSSASLPKGLWIVIPLLNLCAIMFGVVITWVLQRGVDHSFAESRSSLIIGIIVLLLIISLFKGVFTYIRQKLMVALNTKLNNMFTRNFIERTLTTSKEENNISESKMLRTSLTEVQRMQNAIMASLGVLASDGLFVSLLLGGIFYELSFAGWVVTSYLLAVILHAILALPGLSFEYSHLQQLYASAEKTMNYGSLDNSANREAAIKCHGLYSEKAKGIAEKVNKINLLYDCIGAFAVIAVFAIGISKLRQGQLAYGSFMLAVIFSYFITTLTPRILNAFHVCSDGAEAYKQHVLRYPE